MSSGLLRTDASSISKKTTFFLLIGRVLKKSCNIVTTYVGRRTGNLITPNLFFFHGPNSSKSAKKFFLLGG